jgi:hypothetical protein
MKSDQKSPDRKEDISFRSTGPLSAKLKKSDEIQSNHQEKKFGV